MMQAETKAPGLDDTPVMQTPARRARVHALLSLAACVVVWTWTSKAPAQALMWGAVAWVLWRDPRSLRVWRRRTGLLFGVAALYMLAAFTWSASPADSLRDAARLAPILAVTVALPGLLRAAGGPARAVHLTAAALTLVLGVDLVRLVWRLGPDLIRLAHEYEPFALGHSPNVGGACAAAAAVTMGLAVLNGDLPRRCRAAAAIAAALDLAYLVVIASRGAQAAFAVTCAAGALLVPTRPRMRALCLGGLLLAGSVVAIKPEWINPRFKDQVSMRGFADRDVVWKQTWRLARTHPVIGHGYGPRVFKAVYTTSHPPYSRFDFQHPHQYALATLFAFGWAGLVLLAAGWVSLAWDTLRAAGRQQPLPGRYAAVLTTLLLVYVHAFGLADFPGSAVRMMMLWLIPCAMLAAEAARAVPHRVGDSGGSLTPRASQPRRDAGGR